MVDAAHRGRRPSQWWVPAAVAFAVLARLPFVGSSAGADEAGYLQVARQWASGRSLYGSYFVDRPPLLITLFRLAASGSGVTDLRLLGCLAVAASVVLSAWTAHQVAGPVAARWTAATVALLLVSPWIGAFEVNGELLAAPFVALGIGAAVAAVRHHERRPWWASVAGASGTCAVLVKQNIGDVVVFCVVLAAASLLHGDLRRREVGRILGWWLAGVAATVAVVAWWTVRHGTSLPGVWDAMYPFRLRAARATAAAGSFATDRAVGVARAWVTSGLALMTLTVLVTAARRRTRDPVVLALGATTVFDAVSVALGGAYWLHYLVEMVVPLSIGTGLLAARAGKARPHRPLSGWTLPRAVLAVACVSSLVGLAGMLAQSQPRPVAEAIGTSVRAVARPGDTLTTLYGEAQVNFYAGLPSPYEHLWSLPIKTSDPHLAELDSLLAGRAAPTWLVTNGPIATWGLDTAATQRLIDDDYAPVAAYHGQTVFLHRGVSRPIPTP